MLKTKMRITNPRKRKYTLMAILVAVTAILTYLVFAFMAGSFPFQQKDPYDKVINYQKSESEKKREQEIREDPNEKLKNDQRDIPEVPSRDPRTQKEIANVLLTFSEVSNGLVSTGGFISNVVEEGGTCQYKFSSNGKSVTRSVTTLTNATSTTCKSIQIPVSELSAGKWHLVLQYSSADAFGVSEEREVVVP